jgi:hypothetical protein
VDGAVYRYYVKPCSRSTKVPISLHPSRRRDFRVELAPLVQRLLQARQLAKRHAGPIAPLVVPVGIPPLGLADAPKSLCGAQMARHVEAGVALRKHAATFTVGWRRAHSSGEAERQFICAHCGAPWIVRGSRIAKDKGFALRVAHDAIDRRGRMHQWPIS